MGGLMDARWNVPNVISGCRLASVPVLVYFMVTGNVEGFKWLVLFALLSDILDGWIARTFKLETEFGSALDSLADTSLYFVLIASIFLFQQPFVKAHWLALTILLVLYIGEKVKCFITYGVPFNSFHNYSAKVMAYAQGIFIMTLYFHGFQWFVFYPAFVIGIFANIEDIIMTSMLKKGAHDTKGLYWVLQRKRQDASAGKDA